MPKPVEINSQTLEFHQQIIDFLVAFILNYREQKGKPPSDVAAMNYIANLVMTNQLSWPESLQDRGESSKYRYLHKLILTSYGPPYLFSQALQQANRASSAQV